MAFFPSEKSVAPPRCVAMRVREPDLSVYPQVRDIDLRRRDQDTMANYQSSALAKMMDRSDGKVSKVKTFHTPTFVGNGNVLAPPPVPYRPYEPRHYGTDEQ